MYGVFVTPSIFLKSELINARGSADGIHFFLYLGTVRFVWDVGFSAANQASHQETVMPGARSVSHGRYLHVGGFCLGKEIISIGVASDEVCKCRVTDSSRLYPIELHLASLPLAANLPVLLDVEQGFALLLPHNIE